MSRIGRLPIDVPSGVDVTIDGSRVTVKGSKGELVRTFDSDMKITIEGNVVTVSRPTEPRGATGHSTVSPDP